MFDIADEELVFIEETIKKFCPNSRIWVFGSRMKGTNKVHSDLDLVIVSQEPVNWMVIEEIREIFMGSELPFKVDVLEWSSISDAFKEIILMGYVEL